MSEEKNHPEHKYSVTFVSKVGTTITHPIEKFLLTFSGRNENHTVTTDKIDETTNHQNEKITTIAIKITTIETKTDVIPTHKDP